VCLKALRRLIGCWLQRYAVTRYNVIPALAAYPVHNYPATSTLPSRLNRRDMGVRKTVLELIAAISCPWQLRDYLFDFS
jgi:hypothetical protein